MSSPEIRSATETDLPFITAIYDEAVRHGTATFELDPPGLAEMTRRFRTLADGGFPYLVAVLHGRVVGYAYAGAYRPRPAYRFTVENSVYLEPATHRRGIGLQLLLRLSADDCRDRRFSQCRIDRRAHASRLFDDRYASECRPQVRPLARHGDDAARARRGRGHGADGVMFCVIPERACANPDPVLRTGPE
jgi:L-amino acid N-acyltransferase YncA